ncbi:flagellar motor switch protein FliM [Geobacter sp. OR-1]|uniref:flagellar motor switch protein FliM n=1 Tax=Geobacter sp. OR-1 TaxID=1266765 RepID=UPI00054401DA|nr:flagellar motor switch protein FliM [Geobacter sp. OR-1]GAM09688.1 flagellar motor switch protein FliM [Geobacter sp. OR-1]
MENILTKEEIEALLSAVFEGKIDPEKELAKESGGVSNYNLFSSDSSKGFIPNLDIIYDNFIRYYRANLSNRLRKQIEIKKGGARAFKFDDFMQTLPSPVCMAIYKIEPLKGAAIIAFDATMVFAVVDAILGGTGTPKIPENNRTFTSIELRLVEKIIKDMLAEMEKAWAPLHTTSMSLIKIESNPRMVSIVPPEYMVITMNLQVQIEETVGNLIFAVPYMTIDPIREKLKAGAQFTMMAADPHWSTRLSQELMQAPLEVSVQMGTASITLSDLLGMKSGDTVMMDDSRYGSEVQVSIGGIPKFLGMPGVRGGNKAVQVTNLKPRGG